MEEQDTKTVPEALGRWLQEHPRLALAFSGGADSAYLLYAAKACGCDMRAYCVHTAFTPAFEREDAHRMAGELDAGLTVLEVDILENGAVRANPPDRCYHCKRAIMAAIRKAAAADGYEMLVDGTNASDDAGDRPGIRALAEMGVVSPLRLCGVTKAALREYSRRAGLFTADKPAYACLATRVPTGTALTAEALGKVERAEEALRAMGFSDLRVRLLADAAKIQLPAAQFSEAARRREELLAALGGDFTDVYLDCKAR